ncbi:MAG: BREX-6 system phosphatase PglZ [Myxococcota bacterium]|nr:BREX-6 system phosphatase PglZ [Myxococcota bacterium]
MKRSPELGRTWELLRRAAATGKALSSTKNQLQGARSLQEAVDRYAEVLAPVDRLQRELEQRAHALVASDLEDYDALLEVRSSVRRAYREWADTINRQFFELCVTHGALPDQSLRQRAIYDQVVSPQLTSGDRVAFVMVDALRFEMAQGLAEELERDKYVVTLQARLAELPTITAVGMNALAPAQVQGRLRIVGCDGDIKGLASQEAQIATPEARVKAMSLRVGGQVESLPLEDFQDLSLSQLKRRLNGKANLIVVHSQELDTAGESKLHLATFDNTLLLLKSALSLLRQAGVERFVIASDHGFLLQDAAAESVSFGSSMRVPERRHALLSAPSGASDVLEVKLSALEYDVEQDQYLVLRPDTAVWKTKHKIPPFVHGGNSLQERVIPVLVLERHGSRGKTSSRYEVVARPEAAHLGRQRLKIAVRLQRQATGEMSFASPKTISLTLRVFERRDLAVTVLNADPPARLVNGQLSLIPEKEEALVEFEITGGELDEKVRVEIFHAEALEEVTPKIVEGFFDVSRDRRLGKRKDSVPPESAAPSAPSATGGTASWAESIQDEAYRRALLILEQRRSINEAELTQVLGSPRRVRAFSRAFDDLIRYLPFAVEIRSVQGMKAYTRKD